MAVNVGDGYGVDTVYFSERNQGALWSIMHREFRFCAFEPIADDIIECGVFVTLAVDALGVNRLRHLSATTDKIIGVTYLNTQRLLNYDSVLKAYTYAENDIVSLIEEGDLFMYSEVAVQVGDPVFTRFAVDGTKARIGAVANVAGAGLKDTGGSKFLKSLSTPGLVPVSISDII